MSKEKSICNETNKRHGLIARILGDQPTAAQKIVFWVMLLSGVVEPVGAIAVLLLVSLLLPVLPYMLAFAAGAMFYVVVEELIPEASSGQHSNLSTIGFAVGFVLMMVLDVVTI